MKFEILIRCGKGVCIHIVAVEKFEPLIPPNSGDEEEVEDGLSFPWLPFVIKFKSQLEMKTLNCRADTCYVGVINVCTLKN